MKKTKLNITFHNPNTTEETVTALVKIAAGIAINKMNSLTTYENKNE